MEIDPRTRVGSVGLRVADAGPARAFYADVLGLAPSLVALTEAPAAPPAPPRAAGLFHTAFLFPTRAALAAVVRRVGDAGVSFTGASDHGVSEALYLDDPEGNGVELYWDRPREQWPRRPDGGIDMYTAPLDVRALLREDPGGEGGGDAVVGHVHLKVGDLPRSVAFWRDAVGLDLKVLYGEQAAFLAAGDYHHHIGANVWRSAGGPPLPEAALGLERVTLVLPDEAVLLASIEQLREHAEMLETHGGALIRDPDGILIEFRTGA